MIISEISDLFFASGALIINTVTAAVVLMLSVFIGKILALYLRRSLKEKMDKSHLVIILNASYYGIVAITFVFIILPILGVETSSLLVAGSIFGLVIGFASQSIVGNLISGLFLIFERPIKLGNQVNIDGNVGIVEDISLISTIIRTYDGLYVRIPNENVFTTTITNYVANVARRFEYVVGVRYSDDADQAIGIIKNLIEEHSFALKNPEPVVFVGELGNNSVNITVKIWAPSTDWYALKTELLWKIKKTLEENGIEIAFPQRVVWFANESKDQQIADPE
ncbi:mechanosensitive ion channel family protein [Methanococcoides burtonii]|uniref:Small-conductance mechanosensitive ion channel n=1 Tax=Methanococcoides burtonii (strain DSM 6242 / NBRC 107633 / OCM 468 / ACE-M) TaxID=259564 RepID=Q12YL5_METBU|nr:mechanosensitive ion channel family protein [Methanococcoides burtonii]ABE51461.1 Small-conductance mechanosensitive ion channel [Methanococcoides burtonii DSM 6242]